LLSALSLPFYLARPSLSSPSSLVLPSILFLSPPPFFLSHTATVSTLVPSYCRLMRKSEEERNEKTSPRKKGKEGLFPCPVINFSFSSCPGETFPSLSLVVPKPKCVDQQLALFFPSCRSTTSYHHHPLLHAHHPHLTTDILLLSRGCK